MSGNYQTRFGSLTSYEKGHVEPITDDVKNYAFSNCFEIAARAAPYEKIVFGQNQQYVLEVIRTEGESRWYTSSHDEFALCMDGIVEIHLVELEVSQRSEPNKNGAVFVKAEPKGPRMGCMTLKRGHQGMLPGNCAYQLRGRQPGVVVLQTCKGELSIERWSEICQVE